MQAFNSPLWIFLVLFTAILNQAASQLITVWLTFWSEDKLDLDLGSPVTP